MVRNVKNVELEVKNVRQDIASETKNLWIKLTQQTTDMTYRHNTWTKKGMTHECMTAVLKRSQTKTTSQQCDYRVFILERR